MGEELQLGISPADFLARYWQREALLIRAAFADFKAPVDSDTIAGLALEEEVESRIIEYADEHWSLHHGPFLEEDFQRQAPWTLLVQAVDHYLPEVDALRRAVKFLPQWRLDDVMVSYAVDGGSVGPHYDNYDVFLLQGEGRRRWRIGQRCDASTPLLPHDELRILRDFHCVEEYLLEPGDILYIPPGVAHWGIAEGECSTFSIGFRAPPVNEMLCRITDEVLERIADDAFFTDAGRAQHTGNGEILPSDLELARALMHRALETDDGTWFGELVTEGRYELHSEAGNEARERILAGQSEARMVGGAKLAWLRSDDRLTVFANGGSSVSGLEVLPVLEALSREGRLHPETMDGLENSEILGELLDFLLEAGCIYAD